MVTRKKNLFHWAICCAISLLASPLFAKGDKQAGPAAKAEAPNRDDAEPNGGERDGVERDGVERDGVERDGVDLNGADSTPGDTTTSEDDAARDDDARDDGQASRGPPNAELPTAGGFQFWTDKLFFHGWHIQCNAISGHHRLLDEHEVRHGWGTWDECCQRLEQIKREEHLAPMRGKAVIVLHGLFSSRLFTSSMCDYLREHGDYEVFSMGYASTRASVGDHAQGLASIVEHLDGVEEINFVAHSLGNLIVRHYLGDCLRASPDGKLDPRIRRMVMLGPPNHGATRAKLWSDSAVFSGLFNVVVGELGQELSVDWGQLEEKLVIPPLEFGILAGGCGDDEGWHAKIPGDDDGVVGVAETRLSNATDFKLLHLKHRGLARDKQSQEYTLRFLQRGYFVSAEERTPIPEEPTDESRN